MKNRLKNGFTLVELLVTIVLLGVVGAIVIYNMTSVTSVSKESDYDRFIATVKSAAQVYADNNPDAFNELYTTKAFVYFTIGDLIQSGLLDEGLVNPYTEEKVGNKEKIKANLDSVEGGLFFEYPLESSEKETFLVAVSDYIQWDEPYDCMQGQGSYQLSLATEDGERIPLTAENIDTYQVSCSLPEEFKTETKTVNGKQVTYYRTQESGTYDVTYTWVTESGTRKSAKRSLRVLPMLKPTFTASVGTDSNRTEYEYDFNTSPVYEPTYNKSTDTWAGLYITPIIEGADSVDVKYTVSTRTVKPSLGTYQIVVANSNAFTPIKVLDGHNHYKIQAQIYGHHNKEYYYTAGGDEDILVRQELVLLSSAVSGASSSWTYNKTFNISDTYSPVGVEKYEYYISNTSAPSNLNNLAVEQAHVFNRSASGVTSKNVSVINSACTRALNEYQYIFFRAINKNGYVGKWTPVLTANLTNHLAKLITTESNTCSNCNSCCVKDSTSCYYCHDIRYVNFGGKRFILLEKYSNNSILATYDGVSGNQVIPTAIKTGTYTVVTCDGTYTETYKYSSPVLQNIISEGNRILSALPSNYHLFLNYKTWSSGYTSYVGTVNRTIFNKYKTALYETKPYWTTDTYGSSKLIYATSPYNHGNYTTRNNTYFYSIEAGVETQKYAGNYAYVKPLVEFNSNIYICGGSGTSGSPYVIATK